MKYAAIAVAVALCAAGCIKVRTKSEIKPIHITMDVNLRVDKELDNAFADENQQKPEGNVKAMKDMMGRQAAGFTNKAMLEERPSATDEDRLLIAEENAKRLRRFNDIAKSNGTTLESVQRRYAGRMREKVPAGTWYQDDAGKWMQKK